MTCTTFLHDGELNQLTSNKVVNETLQEARKVTGEDWQIIERKYTIRPPIWKFWKKKKTGLMYELYVFVGGFGPWQQINFYRNASDCSINLTNDADLVVAYLYGIITGVFQVERKQNGKA